MQIAKSAACQTFTAIRRDNGTLIVVEKIELHCTMETGRQSQSSSKITEKKMVYSKTASCLIDLHAGFIYLASLRENLGLNMPAKNMLF